MSSENQQETTLKEFISRLYTPRLEIRDIGARQQAQLLSICSLLVCFLLIIAFIASMFIPTAAGTARIILIVLIFTALISYFFSRTRLYTIGSIILTISMAASGFWLVMIGEDPLRSLISTIPFAMILGSILLPFWGMAIISVVIVLATLTVNKLSPDSMEPRTAMVSMGAFMSMGAAFLAAIAFRNSVERHRISEFRKANQDLQALHSDLENRVNERTTSLEQRNILLQAIADFTRITNAAHNESEFLDQAAQFIAERFKFDHIGIFIVDDLGEYALLYASNSQAGKSLISSRYQLRISMGEMSYLLPEVDTLRYPLGGQNYRISRPVSLPDSKTNFSFALITSQKLLGIFNIQTISPNPEYFSKDIMQLMSDQIALSLQNIRLLAQLQSRLVEINQLAGQTTKNSWERILGGETVGYHYDRLQVLPSSETFSNEITQLLLSGHSVDYPSKDEKPNARLIAPIILRGEVIGIIGYEDENPQHEWHAEERVLLETIASRVSLALENSRLLAETQERADCERIVSQVATRMRETLDIDTVLQTAVQEMRQSLGLEQAEVRLNLGSKTEGKKA